MKLAWIAALAASALLAGGPAPAAPDHCPPPAKAAHKPTRPAKHIRHHKHHVEPRYYEDEYAPPPPPTPPRPMRHHVWRDGYGKAYDIGARRWGPPPPCPCPPDHRGRLPTFCRFDVWYGFNHHYGLESGL